MRPSHGIFLRTSTGTACAVRGLPESELRRLLEDPAEPLWRHVDRPVKISHDAVIVRAEIPLLGGTVEVAYKQFRPRNWWKALLGLFRRSRALRGWRLAEILLARQIPTAQPVAAIRPGGWRRNTGYLAVRWIEGAENLHLYGWRLAARPDRQRRRAASRAAESLGRLVGRMHAAGIVHRDLKAANLLVVEQPDHVAAYLIDLDGAEIGRRLTPARRAADLARLAAALEAHPWVTRTACCRFLQGYAAESPPGSVSWKPLWHAVATRSRRIIQRKTRAGEQVL